MTRQIRSRLAGLKLPQHTLAAMLGVSQTKLNLILNGHRKPPAGFEAEAGAGARPAGAGRAGRGEGAGAGAGRRGMSERDARPDSVSGTVALPEVLFLEDVAALLRCLPSTIKRRLRARVFPVAPLPRIDKRHRWSKAAVLEGLALGDRAPPCGGAGGGPHEPGRGTQRRDAGQARRRRVAHRGSRGRRSGVHLPVVLAGGGGVLAGTCGCDGACGGTAPGVGALRGSRSGAGVLMRGIEAGPAETVRTRPARRDGGAWRSSAAKAR